MESKELLKFKEFEKETISSMKFGIVNIINIAIPLYLMFWFADWFYAPEWVWEFLILRLTVLPLSLFIRYKIRKLNNLKTIEFWCIFLTFWFAGTLSLMIFLTEGAGSPYYAGLNLVCIGMLCILPWTGIKILYLLVAIYSSYFCVSIISLIKKNDIKTDILNNCFVIGTIVITTIIRIVLNNLRSKEFISRFELKDEIIKRNEIIKEKIQESLNLKNLSRQFSPQIIDSIVQKKLDLNSGVHYAEICSIFIDIVNSTQRILNLSKESINFILSDFIDETMKSLIKFNLTIDKFLGDGILGFSNDPVKYDDFIERTVQCAFEIRKNIENKNEIYKQHWLSDFQIRIGIAVGPANVGFYGKNEIFKTYTAIGPVVNLASRLCTIAEPNCIVVSGQVHQSLINSPYYHFKDLGFPHLKGFENNSVQVFQLEDVNISKFEGIGSEICPKCKSIMYIDTNHKGHYIFKCRSCGFNSKQ